LYIRQVLKEDGYHYLLRESLRDNGCWKHRDIFDLGLDPRQYITYPGGNGYYFESVLEEALEAKGVRYSADELEEVFLPFLDYRIRHIIENFRARERKPSRWKGLSQEELMQRQQELHSFDKRRLHYLRFARVDIGELEGRPWKFLNVLLGKSRDEIEHTIEEMERVLRPHEVRPYLYTALHLQRYFTNNLLRNEPAGLNPEKVDQFFLDEICSLDQNKNFFCGVDDGGSGKLHPYLTKYVILYFDNEFSAGDLDDYLREFIRRRQAFRQSTPVTVMAVQEALQVLGISKEKFDSMSRKEITRLYRRKAKRVHPDKGGEHDEFVRLTDAYEILLSKK
jgi:hypothetical protein